MGYHFLTFTDHINLFIFILFILVNAEMMEATFGQDLKKLEYLWTRGASIDCHDETNGYTPLHWCPFSLPHV
jgi:hypothetical protein